MKERRVFTPEEILVYEVVYFLLVDYVVAHSGPGELPKPRIFDPCRQLIN